MLSLICCICVLSTFFKDIIIKFNPEYWQKLPGIWLTVRIIHLHYAKILNLLMKKLKEYCNDFRTLVKKRMN